MIAGLEFIRQRKLIKDRELDLKDRERQLDEKLIKKSLAKSHAAAPDDRRLLEPLAELAAKKRTPREISGCV